ncbi:MAG: histidine triad nucleotide-binding protein [Planctomycetota bacterium]
MADCIFCKISSHEIQAQPMIVYEDTEIIGFHDINPQAPLHILVIPKQHFSSPNEFGLEHKDLLGRLIVVAIQIARQEKLAERGYRMVINCGTDGGQAVPHMHLHLLSGRHMDWPPG